MNLVLDVSAAIAFVTNQDKDQAVREPVQNADCIFVPELFIFEASNAFWKIHKFQKVSTRACEESLAATMEIPDEFVSGSSLYPSAWALACELSHSAYDMFYLALAIQENAPLLSLDQKLLGIAKRMGIKTIG